MNQQQQHKNKQKEDPTQEYQNLNRLDSNLKQEKPRKTTQRHNCPTAENQGKMLKAAKEMTERGRVIPVMSTCHH